MGEGEGSSARKRIHVDDELMGDDFLTSANLLLDFAIEVNCHPHTLNQQVGKYVRW